MKMMKSRFKRTAVQTAVLCAAGAALLGATRTCRADSDGWSINAGGVTHHLRNDAQHNDVNPGLGLERRFSDSFGLTMGGYYNSEYRWSNYAYVRYQPFSLVGVRFGAVAGIVSGYSAWGCKVCPAGLLAASRDVGPLTISLVGFPNIGKAIDGIVSVQFSWRLQ